VHILVTRRFMADVGVPGQMTFADDVRLSARHRNRIGCRHGSRLPVAQSRRSENGASAAVIESVRAYRRAPEQSFGIRSTV